ncbi:MAG TPA: AMP-binding protein [Solirubrobacteraceae bacterium]|jgi:O-succinylbenzoic acid--CoA ligase|nr:AMP-binding protein [Solirubrobacteraceae bacterium]
MVVEGWLARAAAKHPGRVAVATPSGSATYAELHADARAGAHELEARGARAGTRVAIALPAGLDMARALHAAMLIGAIAVPVDPRLSTAEREAIAARCELALEEPLACAGADAPAAPQRHDLDAVAAIIHTSGTTAAPRPVELTFGNFLWSALGSAVALGGDVEERWLCAMPLSHVGGLSILLRSAIYATTAILHERFETERVIASLQGDGVTLVSLVATTLARLLDAGLERPPALRVALTGGGPVAPDLMRRARAAGVPVRLTYGLTESCSQATTAPLAETDAPDDAAGPPLFCTAVAIAPDGEILLRGPTVARGAAGEDGWLHTGDLGELDQRGRLRVLARKSETIVSGGENVAPAEVEAVLEEHPDVVEAAVLGREDAQWGEAVVAVIVHRPGRAPEQAELLEHCRARLAPYKVPKEFTRTEDPLPRTASGKLQRRSVLR